MRPTQLHTGTVYTWCDTGSEALAYLLSTARYTHNVNRNRFSRAHPADANRDTALGEAGYLALIFREGCTPVETARAQGLRPMDVLDSEGHARNLPPFSRLAVVQADSLNEVQL